MSAPVFPAFLLQLFQVLIDFSNWLTNPQGKKEGNQSAHRYGCKPDQQKAADCLIDIPGDQRVRRQPEILPIFSPRAQIGGKRLFTINVGNKISFPGAFLHPAVKFHIRRVGQHGKISPAADNYAFLVQN